MFSLMRQRVPVSKKNETNLIQTESQAVGTRAISLLAPLKLLLLLFACIAPHVIEAEADQRQIGEYAEESPVSALAPGDWREIRTRIDEHRRDRQYRVRQQDRALTARNPAHNFEAYYRRDGATTVVPNGNPAHMVTIRPLSIEYRKNSDAKVVLPEAPREREADRNVVTSVWSGDLQEWWVNSPDGLEQWFKLANPPGQKLSKEDRLVVSLELDTALDSSISGTGQEQYLRFTGTSTEFRFEKLRVFDADGKVLPAELGLSDNLVTYAVDDQGARYPLTIDPTFVQQAYLKASNTGPQDNFGFIDVSGDTVAVGAWSESSSATGINGNQNDDTAALSGAVYVFVRDGVGSWTQQAYIKASNAEAGDNFGQSVSLSGDILVVGAPNEDSNSQSINGDQNNNFAGDSGAAYVFLREAGNWTQEAYLKAESARFGDRFGASVSISGDTIAVGAIGEDSDSTGIGGVPGDVNVDAENSGAVYVFTRDQSQSPPWQQEAYIKASNTNTGDFFGVSVSVDNDLLIVGADREDSGSGGIGGDQADNSSSNAGAAYLFERDSNGWAQVAYVKPSTIDSGDRFGYSVSVSGHSAIIGALGEDSASVGVGGDQSNNSAPDSGAAYVFSRDSSGIWAQSAYLKASNADAGDRFGESVSISGDMAIVGAPSEESAATGVDGDESDNSARQVGAAYAFVEGGSGIWSQQSYLKASNAEKDDGFGRRVSVSNDVVAIGAPGEDSNATGVNGGNQTDNSFFNAGAAYVFDKAETLDFGDAPDVTVDPAFAYSTRLVNNGARHVIVSGLFLGASVDAETDGQPDASATGDNNVGSDDEDGVSFSAPAIIEPGATYTATVTATNQTGLQAIACGWIDFNDDGDFDNAEFLAGSTTTDAERACVTIPDATSDGSFDIDFVIPDDFVFDGGGDGQYFSRFRITTDNAFSSSPSAAGEADSGEIEDHAIGTSSLPVSISSFESRFVSEGLVIEWATASETRNAGFYLWADSGGGGGGSGGMELLTAKPIPSATVDPARPGAYRQFVPGLSESEIPVLAITAVDFQGKEKVYGVFEAGKRYGKESVTEPIRWNDIRSGVFTRTSQRGAQTPDSVRAVDFEVQSAGMQSVDWQTLADAGLDLTGVDPADIAVTRNGEPVARKMISGAAGGFQPGDSIRFWGEIPIARDSLYVDRYRYRITVDPASALSAQDSDAADAGSAVSVYSRRQLQDFDNFYFLSSPLEDPWYVKGLRADRDNSYTTSFTVDDDFVPGQPTRVTVQVGGLTDFPADPDHHITVSVNGQVVGGRFFEGQTVEILDLALPDGLLVLGENEVTVTAPGGTDAQFDVSLVDTVALEYTATLDVGGDQLLMPALATGETYRVRGLGADAEVYAWTNDSELVSIESGITTAYEDPDVMFRANFEPGETVPRAVEFVSMNESADYWISTTSGLNQPDLIGGIGENQIFAEIDSEPDFIIIAHPAFLPISSGEIHPLNEFIDLKQAEGWTVGLFDITEIQTQYSGSMPMPEAVNRFLADADTRFDYEHVLLVGGDSYDYTNNLGLDSISFIPTHYSPTRFIPHTPSDALLADLDGDGLSDKAIGRWPVRSQGDLQSIVDKTIAWTNDPQPLSNGAFVTDTQDPSSGSFTAQAEGLIGMLTKAGWGDAELARIYYDELTADAGLSVADTARGELFERLEAGRSLTGFVGHGSPSMWTFQGLLVPDDLNNLYNEGAPTLIGTMTCYTSYFVSPYSDTVAHRWMNGYREDGLGNPIPGVANGAVAVHGAATLSNYDENGRFAGDVLDFQLAGNTLGQAVFLARQEAASRGMADLVINWTLLGDPTLRID